MSMLSQKSVVYSMFWNIFQYLKTVGVVTTQLLRKGSVEWFVPWDVLSVGRFVFGAFCPLGRLSLGTFCFVRCLVCGTFCPVGHVSVGTFCPHGTLCFVERFVRWDVFVMGRIVMGRFVVGRFVSAPSLLPKKLGSRSSGGYDLGAA